MQTTFEGKCSTDKRVFIYGLFDPRNGVIRYIGKAADLKVRMFGHLSDKRRVHKVHWIEQLKACGMSPSMCILEICEPGSDWEEAEKFWIAYHRFIGTRLTNSTNGGEGSFGREISEETRKKIGSANRGKKLPREQIEQMRTRLIGNKYALGSRHSEETRRRVSLAGMGRKKSAETVGKLRASLRRFYDSQTDEERAVRASRHPWIGRHHSIQTRLKIARSLQRPGRPQTVEERIKRSNSLKGRCFDNYTKTLMWASATRRWRNSEFISDRREYWE